MRKYIITLVTVLVAVSCYKFEPEVSRPSAEAAKTPVIQISEITDNSFKVEVRASEGTSFFSYAVVKGSGKVSAASVYKVKAGGIVEGTVDYSIKKSVSFVVEEVDFNTLYTVYAIAGSADGDLSELASKNLTTSDGVAPEFEDFAIKDSSVAVLFSEDVNPIEGAASKIVVKYYGINANSGKDILADIPVGTASVKEIEMDGNVAYFDVNGLPDGAYYSVSIPAGTFEDPCGNKCAAIESSFGADVDGDLTSAGICGRVSTKSWPLSIYNDAEVTAVVNMFDPIWMSVPENVTVAKTNSKAVGSITYVGETYRHEYEIYYGAPNYGFGWNSTYNCALTYPNAGESYTNRPDPNRGDMVTITIPSFLTDIYGNKNEEFVIGPFIYSRGLTVENIAGDYVNSGKSIFSGLDEEAWGMSIAASDDAEKGNIMISNYWNYDCAIYGEFNGDTGEAWFPIDYKFVTGVSDETCFYAIYTFAYYSTYHEAETGLTLTLNDDGTLSANDYPGYYLDIYELPESGNPDDISADAKPIDYGFNLFYPSFSPAAAAASAQMNSVKVPYRWDHPITLVRK